MLRRGYTTQTDYRDSEAQTDPATLGYYYMTTIYMYIIYILSSLEHTLSNLYFYDIIDYAYDYKDVLPEVSALEMLRYGPGGGLPVKDEFDLQTVDRLRYQKMQSDNLPSVEESKRTLVQNRLLGRKISDRVMNISSLQNASLCN